MRGGIRNLAIELFRIFLEPVGAYAYLALEIIAHEDDVLDVSGLNHGLDLSPLYLLRLCPRIAEQQPDYPGYYQEVEPRYSEIDSDNLRLVFVLVCHRILLF